jgi:hypothetical protein
MDPAGTVTRILQSAPGEGFCDPCLSSALEIPLVTIQDITKGLAQPRGDYVQNIGPCDNCGRSTGITAFTSVVVDTVMAGNDGLRKCIRCSRPVTKREEELIYGELFHRQCWAILCSQLRITNSKQITRLSHLLIRQSRERLRPRNEQG